MKLSNQVNTTKVTKPQAMRVDMSINKSRGFSLVELMVAMVLGLILLAGVVNVFVGNLQTFSTNSGVARLQENARFALSELARDIRMAGYRGCDSEGIALNNNLINLVADGSGAEAPFLGFATSIVGYESRGNGTGVWSKTGAEAAAYFEFTDIELSDKADRLVLKSLGTELLRLQSPISKTDKVIEVADASSLDKTDTDKGYLFIGDCRKGASVAITAVDTSSTPNTVSFADSANLSVDVSPSGASYLPQDTYVQKLEIKSYFIAPSKRYVNNRGDRPMALWRRDKYEGGDGDAQELAIGVEDLQVLYGVDTTDDGIPNRYVEASGTLDTDKVVTTRIRVTTNSIDAVGGELLTRDFTLTVRLRNRADV